MVAADSIVGAVPDDPPLVTVLMIVLVLPPLENAPVATAMAAPAPASRRRTPATISGTRLERRGAAAGAGDAGSGCVIPVLVPGNAPTAVGAAGPPATGRSGSPPPPPPGAARPARPGA